MPRRLRIEFEGAIYHVMARGNARQKIVRDDADRRRLIDGLELSVVRHGWELLAYVVMGNHLHLLVNGSYLEQELELDDERFEMIRRLLSRAYDEELPLADTVAASMARATGLPAYQYPTDTYVSRVGTSGPPRLSKVIRAPTSPEFGGVSGLIGSQPSRPPSRTRTRWDLG